MMCHAATGMQLRRPNRIVMLVCTLIIPTGRYQSAKDNKWVFHLLMVATPPWPHTCILVLINTKVHLIVS